MNRKTFNRRVRLCADFVTLVLCGAFVTLVTFATPGVSLAQELAGLGGVTLTPFELPTGTEAMGARIGVDGTGHAYDTVVVESASGIWQVGFDCYALGSPETRVRVTYTTTVGDPPSNPGEGVVVATMGDGAYVPRDRWFSCRDALAGGSQVPRALPLPVSGERWQIVVGPGGDICQWMSRNSVGAPPEAMVQCYRQGETEPAWSTRFDSTTLDAQLEVAPWNADNPTGQAPPKYPCGTSNCATVIEGWEIRALRFAPAPDGRLLMVAVRTSVGVDEDGQYYERFVNGWLLAVDVGTGAVTTLLEPPRPLRAGNNLIASADAVVWDPTLGAALVGPLRNAEWSNDIIVLGNDGGGNLLSGPRGPGGLVALAVRVAPGGGATGGGTVSFTEALAEREVTLSGSLEPGREGEGPRLVTASGRFTIAYDLGRLDLDKDGLSGADEAALGTSDWRALSDGVVTPDGRELLCGTDPLDPDDDWGARVVEPTQLVPSPLWSLRGISADGPVLRSYAGNGAAGPEDAPAPLCRGGACWDASGGFVGSYPGSAMALGADGAHVALFDDEGGVVTQEIRSGRRTRIATAEALAELLGGDGVELVAVDGERAFGVRRAPGRVVWLEAGRAPEVVFELPAPDTLPADDLRERVKGELRVIGFLHESRALLVSARTTWREYLFGVVVGGEVVALGQETGQEVVFPDWVAPYADGVLFNAAARIDDLGLRGWIGALMTPGLDLVPTTKVDAPFVPYPGVPAWGSVFVEDPTPTTGGWLEMVRVPRRAVPGELYVWGRGGLLRQPPRGGLVPVFEEADYGWSSGVTGLALSRDGVLCVVNHALGEVRLLRPALAGGPPALEGGRLSLEAARDCGWDEEGGLWVLATGEAAGVWRAEDAVARGSGASLELRPEVEVGAEPLRFVTPSPFEGAPEVLDRASGICGKFTTRAGRVVTVECGQAELKVDGVAVAVSGPATWGDGLAGGEIVLAERADGRLVMTRGDRDPQKNRGADGPWVIDLMSGRAHASWVEGAGAGYGVAVRQDAVPGVDPWSGATIGPQLPVDPSLEVPETPEAPRDGERLVFHDDGCGGGPAGGWAAWALTALWVVSARVRRQRRTSERRSRARRVCRA